MLYDIPDLTFLRARQLFLNDWRRRVFIETQAQVALVNCSRLPLRIQRLNTANWELAEVIDGRELAVAVAVTLPVAGVFLLDQMPQTLTEAQQAALPAPGTFLLDPQPSSWPTTALTDLPPIPQSEWIT